MIAAAALSYWVLVVVAVALVGWAAALRNGQELRRTADEAIGHLLARHGERTIVTLERMPELFVSVRRPNGGTLTALPSTAAAVISEAARLEQAEGGRGVVLVLDGSREESDRFVLRLLPRLADAGAAARLRRVREQLALMTGVLE